MSAAVLCMPIQPDCTDEDYRQLLRKLGSYCVKGNYRECTWDRIPCTEQAVTCTYSMCGFNTTSAAVGGPAPGAAGGSTGLAVAVALWLA